MILPWYIIRKVQTTTARKAGLVAIFSVVLITIACDILRTVKSFSQGAYSDSSLYTSLEVSLAVIVSCMPVYRKLFNLKLKKKAKKHPDPTSGPTYGITEQQLLTSTSSTWTNKGFSKAKIMNIFTHGSNNDSSSGQRDPTSHGLQDLPQAHLANSSHNVVHANSMV